jgi:hypothetical protein
MAKGMALLSTAFNRALTDELVEVFHGVIGARLDAQQWERAVRRTLDCETFFPPPAVLLRYGLAEGAPEARAVEFYERIVEHYEAGETVDPREISERYGTAAVEGFLAAGGSRAFAWCEPASEPFRRKAFIEAWLETVEQEPARALPPAAAPSSVEASEIVRQIAAKAGVSGR